MSVLNQVRGLFGRDVFVNLDAPAQVGLFAYDNRTFIVQNYQAQPVSARVSVVGANRLQDLLTTEAISATQSAPGNAGRGFSRGNFGGNSGAIFEVRIPGHSFRVFRAE